MFAWSGSVNCIFTQICTIGRLRRIVVIDRSRGVCGESDVGNKKLLAPVVAVSGAFATAIEIPMLAVKNAGIRHKKALHSQLQLKHQGLR